MYLEWSGSDHEASAWVHQRECRVQVEHGKVRMFIDGREFVDPTVADMTDAKRTLERAAFRRSGGRITPALHPS
jgi:hypothetical protein